ncbi:hypothetical protein AN476_08675 [Phaeobacter sp. 11ANDIMAR09]|nr:hypothetical protein AN476_08675 [Phaeobacter sp. 11ANDIMAR09]
MRLTKAHLLDLHAQFIESGAAVGKDGIRVERFGNDIDNEIAIILRKVSSGTYKYTSYREKLISKGAGKNPRQISIPTVRDKLVLKFLSELLAEIYPEHVSQPPHHYIKRIHRTSAAKPASNYYLRLDIQNFYPSIDHKILMRILRRTIRQKQLLKLVEDAIKTPTGSHSGSGSVPITGVPQGLSISNILASLYLSEMDKKFETDKSIEYFRFVDDMLVLADYSTAKRLSTEIPVLLKSKRKIKCHPVGSGSKSILVSLAEGIDYLGYHFCQSKIEVRSSSYKKMFSNLMKLFSAMKYRSNKGPILWRMNLRISGCIFDGRRVGWLFFFAQSNNTQQLKRLDAFVSQQAKKVLDPADRERLKTFTRAYHEIRFNYEDSKYFLNFDQFDDAQKRAEIGILLPQKSLEEIETLEGAELDKLFRKCISKEIGDLEKDMMEVFS